MVSARIEKYEKKWRQKIVQIYEFNEKMEAMKKEAEENKEDGPVGPSSFVPIYKLG